MTLWEVKIGEEYFAGFFQRLNSFGIERAVNGE